MGGLVGGASGILGSAMGGIGSIVGSQVGGLVNGVYDNLGMNNNFQAMPAQLLQGVDTTQTGNAYTSAQDAIKQQSDFVNALQAQNGIGNQSAVYNQLGNIANGTGPNPAQAMLAQQTGANVAQQAAMMAGQRGSGANAGLIARQAAMQGGNLQQQAVGQGATMQANQSLNALNMQGGLATQQVGQQAGALNAYNQSQQNEQATLLNALTAQNNARVQMQSNLNTANQATSAGNQSAKSGFLGSITGAAGAAAGMAHGGMVRQNYADGALVASVPTANMTSTPQAIDPTPTVTAKDPNAPKSNVGQYHVNKESKFAGAFNTATPGSGVDAMQKGFAQLGQGIYKMNHKKSDGGGSSSDDTSSTDYTSPSGMPSADAWSSYTQGGANPTSEQQYQMYSAPGPTLPGGVDVPDFAKGGKVPAMVSPGEVYLPPNKAKEVVAKGKDPIKSGERIPGKAKVKGDSLKNDTVPKTLEAGGIVIPRSIMESDDAANNAAKFVAAHLAKNGRMPRKP